MLLPDPSASQQTRLNSEKLTRLRGAVVVAKGCLLLTPLLLGAAFQCVDPKQKESLLPPADRPCLSLLGPLGCEMSLQTLSSGLDPFTRGP